MKEKTKMNEASSYLIKNGKIIDGTGNPWFYSDVLIEGGKIETIAPRIQNSAAEEIIDASGLIVCPGFIDIHTHSDYTILISRGENVLTQGVTTHVVGNCGFSLTPMHLDLLKDDKSLDTFRNILGILEHDVNYTTLDEYLGDAKIRGIPVNLIPLIGHSTLRMNAMGLDNREPSMEELELMKNLLKEELERGAFGLSTGLDYPPGSFAKTEEIMELCKVVKEYNGIYTTHIRGFAFGLIKATKEAIQIAETGVSVEINHFKPFGFWRGKGKMKRAQELVEEARKKGLDVNFDVFPHASNSTFLFAMTPPWVYLSDQKVDIPRAIEILNNTRTDFNLKEKIYREMTVIANSFLDITDEEGWNKIFINAPNSEKYNGHTVFQNAKKYDMDPREVIIDVLIEQNGSVSGTYLSITPEDNILTITHPLTMYASDGRVIPEKHVEYFPNPYCNGTFTRVLGRHVREEKLLPLHDAIRRMTSYPAQKLNLKERGLLREGFWADIAIFNPNEIMDKATYEEPRLYSEGMHHVFVNGKPAIFNKEFTGIKEGMPIKRST
ncbi:MAG: N-acyl-D-amino-acid deacylase family protein [Promethearchaeota archaeon]